MIFSFPTGLLKLNHILCLHRHLLCFLPLESFAFSIGLLCFFKVTKCIFKYMVLLICPFLEKRSPWGAVPKHLVILINVKIIRATVPHWVHCWASQCYMDEYYYQFMRKVGLYLDVQVPAIKENVPTKSWKAVVLRNMELLILPLSVFMCAAFGMHVCSMPVDRPRNLFWWTSRLSTWL